MSEATNAEDAGHNFADAAVNTDAPAAPVSAKDRISSLDFIRGVAVLGILWANIIAFGQPFSAYLAPEAFIGDSGDPDGWMWITQFVLIDGKMRGLFTILFGAGMYLFMERAWERGSSRWIQVWRLVILALFGMIHFFFIWMGDILFYYGFLGLAAVGCLRWKAKTQLFIGIISFVIGALMTAAPLTSVYIIAETPAGAAPEMSEIQASMVKGVEATLAQDMERAEFKISGDYAGMVKDRMTTQTFEQVTNALVFIFETVPLMLIGMGLYRYGFFNGNFDRRKMIIWGWAGVIGGGVGSLLIGLFVKASDFSYFAASAAFLGWSPLPKLAMVIGFAALMVIYSPQWTGWLGSRISAAGRVAFTNYLGTSILMLFVFHGWGLGLFGELNRPQLYGVAALTCALMLAWSKPWLDRYKYGPLEWLWRCLTYRKLFALKR